MPEALGGASGAGHAYDLVTNATIVASGSQVLDYGFGDDGSVNVTITIVGPVAGVAPTLQFTLSDLDQDGNAWNGSASPIFTATAIPTTYAHAVKSGRQQLSWVVTGAGASFGGVFVSVAGTSGGGSGGGGGNPTPAPAELTSAPVSVSAAGDNVLVAGVAAQVVRIYRLFLVFDADVAAFFRDGAAGAAFSGSMAMLASGSITFDFDGEPWFTGTAGNAFVLNLGGVAQVSGRIYYTQG